MHAHRSRPRQIRRLTLPQFLKVTRKSPLHPVPANPVNLCACQGCHFAGLQKLFSCSYGYLKSFMKNSRTSPSASYQLIKLRAKPPTQLALKLFGPSQAQRLAEA